MTLGGGTTRFLHDGDDLVEEYDGSGTMTRRYAHWIGDDVPLLSYAGATLNQPSYLHADQQGSIVLVSDQSGNPSINRYDEYGIPQSGNVGRFGYTGQAFLTEIGMSYYKARIYSPTLGRFLQTDPIGYGDGMNFYAYVRNDPINWRDPSGLGLNDDPCEDCTGPDGLSTGTRLTPPRSGWFSTGGSVSGHEPSYFTRYSEVGAGGAVGGPPRAPPRPPRRTRPAPPPPPPAECPGAWQEWLGNKEGEIGGVLMLIGADPPGAVLVITGIKDVWVGQFRQWLNGC